MQKFQKPPTHSEHSVPGTTGSSSELLLFWFIRDFVWARGTTSVSGFDQIVCESIKEVSGLGYFEDEDVFCASWVQLNGIKYQLGSLLVTSLVQEDIPLFT